MSSLSESQLKQFWPSLGAWWDAIAWDSLTDTIVLVEAKSHIRETYSSCKAKSLKSKLLIKKSMKTAYTHYAKSSNQIAFDFDKIWFETYYQLGNRLAFLYFLQQYKINVKLILLNFVNDPTIETPTSESQWNYHYHNVFTSMLGTNIPPSDVVLVNFEV